MGTLTNVKSDDVRLPILRHQLKQQGIPETRYFTSQKKLTADNISNTALQTMWRQITGASEASYNNMRRFGVLAPTIDNDATMTLPMAKAAGIKTIHNLSDNVRRTIIFEGGHSETEALGWGDKVAIAKLIIDTSATDDEIAEVQAEATTRAKGETVNELALLQLDRAHVYRTKRAVVDGLARRAKDLVSTAGSSSVVNDAISEFAEDVATQLADIVQ